MNTEGGAVQVDGNGTMFVCEASILNCNRNKGMKKWQAEEILRRYYGVRQVIWLKGKAGIDITDMHCDVMLKFPDPHTMLTMAKEDLVEWEEAYPEDVDKIHNALDADGRPYRKIFLPSTVHTYEMLFITSAAKGNYINCYCGNKVVLVPQYGDPNDQIALDLIAGAYPGRRIVGVNILDLFYYGGMIHCVTQQQPIRLLD